MAPRVGYESASHFTRDFKERFDLPPAEYVARLLEQAGAGSGKKIAAPGLAAPSAPR